MHRSVVTRVCGATVVVSAAVTLAACAQGGEVNLTAAPSSPVAPSNAPGVVAVGTIEAENGADSGGVETDGGTAAAAAGGPLSASPGYPPSTYVLADVIIRLERTPCFGACPVYTLSLFGDGRIVLDAERSISRTHDTVPEEDFFELVENFYEDRFFTLLDEYTTLPIPSLTGGVVEEGHQMVTDLPTTIITFEVGGYKKRVSAYYAYPEFIDELADQIDEAAGIERSF